MKISLGSNRGIALIASYIIIAVLLIVSSAFTARSIGEQRVANKEKDSVQAFWLAEAGLDRAINELPDTPLSGTLGRGAYSTQTTPATSVRFLITSSGGVPALDSADPNNIVRTITALVEQPANDASPDDITSAITANGDIVIRGSAEVNGDIDDNETFYFEDVFGVSKEVMKNNATNLYTDPSNNVTPVTEITWSDLVNDAEMIISDSNWEGSGILVVNGDLRLTGGHFRGIIWVIGALWVSGEPVVEGTFYVESGAEFETTLTGNPTVSYDSDAIADAFNYNPSGLPPFIVNWKED
ncbi:MAG: pilus assembly PilX N-terminal domain-containing protein [Candidatus Omnitrophica bacterium]|nr:pilus assembly PilX N-terminal domain-containing protein [Candidatus Omnitrophota bacterium]MBU4457986.1 pilus assembly PilX N-terminal domain-containing protein [Candidatus Omnitrophota bacterium]